MSHEQLPPQEPADRNEIADLVNVDEMQRVHRPDGEFISDYEVEQIAANQDQIRGEKPAPNSSKPATESATPTSESRRRYQVPSKPRGSMNEMEKRADADLAKSARERDVEARAITPAVQALNDRAEFEIWGSSGAPMVRSNPETGRLETVDRGDTTWLDPETGEVIASPDKPSAGKIEDIRHNPKYGKTEAERERSASDYASAIDSLLEDGFELCQAKLVMDLREKDFANANDLAAKFMTEGMNAGDAQKRALDFYDKMDAKRRQLIKEKSAFTEDEYKLLRAGRNWGTPSEAGQSGEKGEPGKSDEPKDPSEKDPDDPTNPKEPIDPEEPDMTEQEREAYRSGLSQEFMEEYAFAEMNLTELLAKRERVQGVALKTTKKAIAEAQAHFDALRTAAKTMSRESMLAAGLSDATFELRSAMDDETENRFIALNTAAMRMDLARPKGEGRRAEMTQKFYDWWVRQGGAQMSKKQKMFGNIKKGMAVAGVTIPVGIVAGIFLPVSAGAAVGGAIAFAGSRTLGRGFARGRIDQNAQETNGGRAKSLKEVETNVGNVAVQQALARMASGRKTLGAMYEGGDLRDSIASDYVDAANKGAFRNRRRLGAATLMGAGFGAIGAEIGSQIADAVGGAHHVAPVHNGGVQHQPVAPQHPQPPVHGTTGQEFYVEHGSGEIREMSEYASSHHYNVTPQQMDQIYNQMFQQHGSKIIDLKGSGPDTYMIGAGNEGLSHPGSATWYPGIEAQIRQMMEQASEENASGK